MKLKKKSNKPTLKLMLGDCLELIRDIPDSSVDLILTDPPYIISKDSGYVNNSLDKLDYIKKYGKHTIDFGEWDKKNINLPLLFSQFYRVLKPTGTLVMFYDIWKMQEVKEIAEYAKFKQPRIGCWCKTNPVPINSKLNYLSNAKEYFCTFVKKSKPTFNSEYDNGDYYVEPEDTHLYPICHGKERLKHPTQKPLALMNALVEKHSNPGDTVLDCFLGSGTTGESCKLLKRNFIGMEMSEQYFEMSKERLK